MARAAERHDWLLGFPDETWWSRLSRPGMALWGKEGQPPRLVGGAVPPGEPKALACYGMWLPEIEQTWLRFVDGRPISAITTQFLTWCAAQAAQQEGITRLVWFWDNASWHTSRLVREAVRTHNQQVHRAGQGVVLTPYLLPSRSPWLNPIEPQRVLSLADIEGRVCPALHCPQHDHLSLASDVP